LSTEELIEALKDQQVARCSYGAREGDGKTCDCKFVPILMAGAAMIGGERTGCCELRMAIRLLEMT
jgi:hypothetical protein